MLIIKRLCLSYSIYCKLLFNLRKSMNQFNWFDLLNFEATF